MFGSFERTVAGRYLRARKGERFVSVIAIFSLIGIALGVATLIIVMSVMNGFRQDLLSRILGLNGDLGVYGAGGTQITDYDATARTIRGIPGVINAASVYQGEILLTGAHGGATGGVVRGISQTDLEAQTSVSNHMLAGSIDAMTGDDAVIIGSGLAQSLGLTVGGNITFVSPQGNATAIGTIPRIRAYKVVGIFNVGMQEYDSTFVFMPIDAAQTFFDAPGKATQIEVTVKNHDDVSGVNQAIRAALPSKPISVVDWQQSNDSFFAAVTVERNVMFLILTLIIVVAAFNVISSMIMMVKDKTRDIAVLRTLGASRGAIMRIFLMAGASIGVTGTLIGFVLGVVFCANIERIRQALEHITGTTLFDPTVYFLEQLPAVLDWSEVTTVLIMALVLSLLATLYPSWRAARTDPVEALRHE
ncbi:lipoprotein-releasing ABC transporter permease subunit [Acidisoma cellulosilytica]|uniref:Lipoprotein-releasing ABC transporter permease subunit n=1 Tax=Acidisoma cellulosilyticum TaxID=2802395 RepID=A0A963YWW9_9PROT|nr:lipoprotein-releasing ABC transporter permease subunit [Acidisoma cellulosilyticum]MCB8878631.1 lipoprotein-releasing ABC transporter permease subunit [Acidisoma cellulosilyticum]